MKISKSCVGFFTEIESQNIRNIFFTLLICLLLPLSQPRDNPMSDTHIASAKAEAMKAWGKMTLEWDSRRVSAG